MVINGLRGRPTGILVGPRLVGEGHWDLVRLLHAVMHGRESLVYTR